MMEGSCWESETKFTGGATPLFCSGASAHCLAWYLCPQTQRSQKKKMKRRVKVELRKLNTMTEAEASVIQDVWQLDLSSRWQLYRYGCGAVPKPGQSVISHGILSGS